MEFKTKILQMVNVSKPDIQKPAPYSSIKKLIYQGIEKQIVSIRNDIDGYESDGHRVKSKHIRRWYLEKEHKDGYYCFLKYQNRNIPYLDYGQTAIEVGDLEEAFEVYEGLKAEIEKNPKFVEHLIETVKKMNLAKGSSSKKR